MEIFINLFLCWAITNVLVNGSILDPLRNFLLVKSNMLGKLLSCITCSGFWVGFFIYFLLYYNPGIEFIITENFKTKAIWVLIDLVFFSFSSSGFSVLVNSLIVYFLKKSS